MTGLLRKGADSPSLKLVVMATLILARLFSGIAGMGSAAALASSASLSELPLTFPVQSPEVAAYFNAVASSEDIASFPAAAVRFLPQVTAGKKMVVFASWAEAERNLDSLVDQIDLVMYNPEHWAQTPANEQENMVATVRRAADFAHARGLRFMFAPDRRFAEANLKQIAPYVDGVLLQGQRLQDSPTSFASWIRDMAQTAHSANPKIVVYAQVGATAGTAAQMLAAVESVDNDIDGIAVWSVPKSLDILQEFVKLVRDRPPTSDITPTPTVTTGPTRAVPTTPPPALITAVASQSPSSEPTPTILLTRSAPATSLSSPTLTTMVPLTDVLASPTPTQPAKEGIQAREWLERTALVAAGIAIGLLVGFVAVRRLARRSTRVE